MSQQVRQQACKTHTSPYGLKQRRRPQFPMPTDPPTIRPRKVASVAAYIPSNNAAPVTPREPMFTCPDSRPTRMQNFTALAFTAAEKSVTA